MKFNSLEWMIKIGDLFDKCKNEDEVEWLYDQLMAIVECTYDEVLDKF